MIAVKALPIGRSYRVIYRNPADTLARQLVGELLEADESTLVFDLRPVAGTTPVPTSWVKEMWFTDMQHMIPTIYRREVRVF